MHKSLKVKKVQQKAYVQHKDTTADLEFIFTDFTTKKTQKRSSTSAMQSPSWCYMQNFFSTTMNAKQCTEHLQFSYSPNTRGSPVRSVEYFYVDIGSNCNISGQLPVLTIQNTLLQNQTYYILETISVYLFQCIQHITVHSM